MPANGDRELIPVAADGEPAISIFLIIGKLLNIAKQGIFLENP